jgi:type II restriction enzyme
MPLPENWKNFIPTIAMMNLSMTGELAAAYKSGSQKAGNVTEAWGADNFYCPNCSSPKLDWLKPGTKASDYKCPSCGFWYQLKSKKSRIGKSIRDGAYGAMIEAIREDRAPSFFFLHYDFMSWSVKNLLLIPHFAFPSSAIIKCPPLSPTARRAGWVGCNFDLNRIPADARIAVIAESKVTPPKEVREQFRKIKPLKELSVKERGWTLDVLNGVRSLGKKEFTNTDAYTLAGQLENCIPIIAISATKSASSCKSCVTQNY